MRRVIGRRRNCTLGMTAAMLACLAAAGCTHAQWAQPAGPADDGTSCLAQIILGIAAGYDCRPEAHAYVNDPVGFVAAREYELRR